MSVASMLIIQPDKLPTYEAIRDEIRKKSDPVELFGSVDLRAHTGYLPMRVYGRETGFECCFGMTSEGEVSSGAHRFGTHRILTRTGSDFEEGRAALLFLRVVARLSGGAFVCPADEIIIYPDRVDSYLTEQIDEYGNYIR